MSFKKNFKFKGKDNYEDKDYVPSQDVNPGSDEKHHATLIDFKTMKGLPNSSYAVKVDPYTEVNNPATPYHFIAPFNKIIGGRYSGVENLGGGNLIQYNSSLGSKFLKVFDSALVALGINYCYLPIVTSDTARGKEMVNEMRKAISEVVSSLNATTYKDQNIFRYAIATDLPMGDAVTKEVQIGVQIVDHQEVPVTKAMYTDIADVIYAYCIEYQLYIQNYCNVFNMFNALRSRMGTMVRMSWNREVSVLNSYFGLLKKKSFLALFDSFALNLQGEYVDEEFMHQANTINMIASRKSNDINNPVLEVASYINMPDNFELYICTTSAHDEGVKVFGSDMMKYTPSGYTSPVDFETAVRTLTLRCTINDTLFWARSLAEHNITENDRYNEIVAMINVLTYCMSIFKPAFEDLRTILNIMSGINVVRWKLGVRLSITQDTDTVMMNYLVARDIYQLIFSGATTVKYNNTTKRWRTHTLWNTYYGTPEYATKSGGIFLSLSCKNIDLAGASVTNVGYLPIGFSIGKFAKTGDNSNNYCRLICRSADTGNLAYYITREEVTMHTNPVLTRLCPLSSQNTLQMFVPKPVGTVATNTDKAFLYRVLLQIAGVCRIGDDFGLEPDSLAVYEYEIEDFTNEVISFCRGNGPFMVSNAQSTALGFYGLAEGAK